MTSKRLFVLTCLARHDGLRGKFAALPVGVEGHPDRCGDFRIGANHLRRSCALADQPHAGERSRRLGSLAFRIGAFYLCGGVFIRDVSLPAGTGALLLFGAVQATMIGYGLWAGERLRTRQAAGFLCALGGLVGLLLPGVSAPPLLGSGLMLGAGIAWGVYSLRGRSAGEPTLTTAENFRLAAPFAIALSVARVRWFSLDGAGFCRHAVVSGALASGVGYAVWYTALRELRATHAAIVQLSVPVIAAAGGILFLGEHLRLRLLIASSAILGGIAMVILDKQTSKMK